MHQITEKNKKIIYSFMLIIIPVFLLFLAAFITKEQEQYALTIVSEEEAPPTLINRNRGIFNDLEIQAKSAIVLDLNTGEIIFEKDADKPLPLASITKILTALTFVMTQNDVFVTITYEDLQEEGDHFLSTGEVFSSKDLVDFMLLTSSNDAAAALASNASGSHRSHSNNFVWRMNQVAKDVGMKNSFFSNPTGLDEGQNIAGAHGTAKDISNLVEYILKNYPNLLESTRYSSIKIYSKNGIMHNPINTNQNVNVLPNTIISKTGFTDLAGGNLIVVIDPVINRPVIIVVLGSTHDGRFEDVKKLTEKTIEYFKN